MYLLGNAEKVSLSTPRFSLHINRLRFLVATSTNLNSHCERGVCQDVVTLIEIGKLARLAVQNAVPVETCVNRDFYDVAFSIIAGTFN